MALTKALASPRTPRLLDAFGLRGPKPHIETTIVPPLAKQRTTEAEPMAESRAETKTAPIPALAETGISTEVTIAALPFHRELVDCATWFSRMSLGDLVKSIRSSEELGHFTPEEADGLVFSVVQIHATDALLFDDKQDEQATVAELLSRCGEKRLADATRQDWRGTEESSCRAANRISLDPRVVSIDTDGHPDTQCLRIASKSNEPTGDADDRIRDAYMSIEELGASIFRAEIAGAPRDPCDIAAELRTIASRIDPAAEPDPIALREGEGRAIARKCIEMIAVFGGQPVGHLVRDLRISKEKGEITFQEHYAVKSVIEAHAIPMVWWTPEWTSIADPYELLARKAGFDSARELLRVYAGTKPADIGEEFEAAENEIGSAWASATNSYIARLMRECGEEEMALVFEHARTTFESISNSGYESLERDRLSVENQREVYF